MRTSTMAWVAGNYLFRSEPLDWRMGTGLQLFALSLVLCRVVLCIVSAHGPCVCSINIVPAPCVPLH